MKKAGNAVAKYGWRNSASKSLSAKWLTQLVAGSEWLAQQRKRALRALRLWRKKERENRKKKKKCVNLKIVRSYYQKMKMSMKASERKRGKLLKKQCLLLCEMRRRNQKRPDILNLLLQ